MSGNGDGLGSTRRYDLNEINDRLSTRPSMESCKNYSNYNISSRNFSSTYYRWNYRRIIFRIIW